MNILKANLNDLDEILDIVYEQRAYLKENNIPQWQGDYPDRIDFEEDIKLKRLYVVKDEDKVVSFFALVYPDHNYDYIEDGKWLTSDKYIAVHRLAVKETYKRKGIATFIFNELKKEYPVIRIDTHDLNKPMNTCLKNNDFIYCGIVYMEDKTKRNAYEWKR